MIKQKNKWKSREVCEIMNNIIHQNIYTYKFYYESLFWIEEEKLKEEKRIVKCTNLRVKSFIKKSMNNKNKVIFSFLNLTIFKLNLFKFDHFQIEPF
jgi:hypothetical protein